MVLTTRPFLALTMGAALVLLAGCGSSGGAPKSAATTTVAAPTGPPIVKIGTTKYGPTLVDSRGKTLYVDDTDPDGQATCLEGLCSSSFPPMFVTHEPFAVGTGLKASSFRTVPGLHGAKILAMNGRALYRCLADKAPGQTKCQNANRLFHVMGANGIAITKL